MKDEIRIREEVDRTLNSLDQDGVLEENPFLPARLLAQRNLRLRGKSSRLPSGVILAYAAIVLLLLVNLATVVFSGRFARNDASEQLVSALKEDLRMDQSQDNF